MNENLPDMNSIDMLLNVGVYVRIMMFNATLNNFKVIWWLLRDSVLWLSIMDRIVVYTVL